VLCVSQTNRAQFLGIVDSQADHCFFHLTVSGTATGHPIHPSKFPSNLSAPQLASLAMVSNSVKSNLVFVPGAPEHGQCRNRSTAGWFRLNISLYFIKHICANVSGLFELNNWLRLSHPCALSWSIQAI
jgi:hypothetical protein